MEDDKKEKLETDKPNDSSEARKYLKGLIDPLADLADAGDRQVQTLLLDFISIGKMLLETAVAPGEPCPSCGVVHGEEDAEETAPPSDDGRIIN